ncbi:MAG: hypothetical protein ACI9OE_001157 [Mariniflexile sp.]|jgi:hypothetical protein
MPAHTLKRCKIKPKTLNIIREVILNKNKYKEINDSDQLQMQKRTIGNSFLFYW